MFLLLWRCICPLLSFVITIATNITTWRMMAGASHRGKRRLKEDRLDYDTSGWALLCAALRHSHLLELDVGYTGLGSKAADILGRAGLAEQLTSLDLRGNALGDAGVGSLSEAVADSVLEVLVLRDNKGGLGAIGLDALRQGYSTAVKLRGKTGAAVGGTSAGNARGGVIRLRELDLSGMQILSSPGNDGSNPIVSMEQEAAASGMASVDNGAKAVAALLPLLPNLQALSLTLGKWRRYTLSAAAPRQCVRCHTASDAGVVYGELVGEHAGEARFCAQCAAKVRAAAVEHALKVRANARAVALEALEKELSDDNTALSDAALRRRATALALGAAEWPVAWQTATEGGADNTLESPRGAGTYTVL